jgi:hypothetical protein
VLQRQGYQSQQHLQQLMMHQQQPQMSKEPDLDTLKVLGAPCMVKVPDQEGTGLNPWCNQIDYWASTF